MIKSNKSSVVWPWLFTDSPWSIPTLILFTIECNNMRFTVKADDLTNLNTTWWHLETYTISIGSDWLLCDFAALKWTKILLHADFSLTALRTVFILYVAPLLNNNNKKRNMKPFWAHAKPTSMTTVVWDWLYHQVLQMCWNIRTVVLGCKP